MPGTTHNPEYSFNEDMPAGSTKGYDADNWIRSNWKRIDAALGIEHYAPSNDSDASEDDYGRHDYITLKERTAKPDLSGSTSRWAVYPKSDGIYYEEPDGTETILLTTETVEVPSGSKMLFYADTAPTGWTIDNTVDDKLVFVTKGSAAGGETGGGAHATGTWTIAGLTNAAEASHTHVVSRLSWGNGATVATGTVLTSAAGGAAIAAQSDKTSGAGSSHNHTISSAGTWRPAAYCYILCTKD